MGGSGRQSATKLAAHMADCQLYQVEITKTYTATEWRDDVRHMMRMAGYEGKETVFLFSDNQIKDESFVEDINMILNTADIPNLFEADEKVDIIEKVSWCSCGHSMSHDLYTIIRCSSHSMHIEVCVIVCIRFVCIQCCAVYADC